MEVTMFLTAINLICCIITVTVGIMAWVELKSFMKSTHKVEFVPMDNGPAVKNEPLRDQDLNEYDL